MVKRIVKMTFQEDQCDAFLALFNEYKLKIRTFPGCASLKLLRAHHPANVFFTYSTWEDPSNLEDYRKSTVFSEVWPRTKELFAAPAEAWTTDVLHDL
ncbi:MAG: putative quinol monooxygenase [Flavobacteriales bacterium]|jgi:autoinducer 2-degrading protein